MKPIKEVGAWTEQFSSSGKRYYYNSKTEVSQWEKPDEWKEHERKLELEEQQKREQAAMYASTNQHQNVPQMSLFSGQMVPPPPPPFPPMPPLPFTTTSYSNPYGPGPMNPMYMGVQPIAAHQMGHQKDGHHMYREGQNMHRSRGRDNRDRDFSRSNREDRGGRDDRNRDDRDRGAGNSRDRDRERDRDRIRERDRPEHHDRDRDRDHSRGEHRDHKGGGSGGRDRDRDRERERDNHRDRDRVDRDRDRIDREREKQHPNVEDTDRNRKRLDIDREERPAKAARPGSRPGSRSSIDAPPPPPPETEKPTAPAVGYESAEHSEGGKQSGSQPMDIDDEKESFTSTSFPDVAPPIEVVVEASQPESDPDDGTQIVDLQKFYSPELAERGWASLGLSGTMEENRALNFERIEVMKDIFDHGEMLKNLYSARILVGASNFHSSLLDERLKSARAFNNECEARIREINNSGQIGPLNMADITNTTSTAHA